MYVEGLKLISQDHFTIDNSIGRNDTILTELMDFLFDADILGLSLCLPSSIFVKTDDTEFFGVSIQKLISSSCAARHKQRKSLHRT